MPSATPPPAETKDSFSLFDQGMNSGVASVLLPKNQMAFASSASVRGTYVKPRPPWMSMTLNFVGGSAVKTAFTTGLWQQACYMKYDNGTEVHMVAISGKLYEVVIGTSSATVTDVTGSTPQSATATQHWMVQAEYYLIWNDGINLPVFYDSRTKTTARSIGNVLAPVPQPAGYTGVMTSPVIIPANTASGSDFHFSNISSLHWKQWRWGYSLGPGSLKLSFTVSDVTDPSNIVVTVGPSMAIRNQAYWGFQSHIRFGGCSDHYPATRISAIASTPSR